MTTEARPFARGRHLVTRDGATVFVRSAEPDDLDALRALYDSLSPESAYARFLGFAPAQADWLERLVDPADADTCTLVAESQGRIVATASYLRNPRKPHEAEASFTVADAWHGRGLGTLLLEGLARAARENGIDWLYGWTRTDNDRMLGVFREAGFPTEWTHDGGLVRATLDLSGVDAFAERHAQRAEMAAYESIRPFLEPRSVAVIGASRSRDKVGGQLFANLHETGFTGRLYAVNPSADSVDGIRSYPSIADIPDPIDLAVITVPAPAVPDVVDECLAKGIKAMVVITAGFAETGEEGRALQERILQNVRRAGARLIGPNCMGILNTSERVRLNATFAPSFPPPGRVAMSTQSGALGLVLLASAERLGLGISSFVSIGNKADVSGNDLIQYWTQDAGTDVILMYTEGFGNPRKFAEIARRASMRKPIVVLKAGRTAAGLRAAQSHTAALATDDAVVDALLHQCGVIRVRSMEQLFDTALALVHEPLPRGRRTAILTNGGGAGILAADACETEGLEVTTLEEGTVAALREFLPAAAATSNPVDMIASAPPEHYARAIPLLLRDENVDSLIVLYVPPAVSDPDAIARAVAEALDAEPRSKPVVFCFLSPDPKPAALDKVATYRFPEDAAAALARMTAHAEWRRTAATSPRPAPEVDVRPIRRRLQEMLASGTEWLDPVEVDRVLRDAGVPMVRAEAASTENEAVQAAERIGFPVAVKVVGPGLIHKTDVQGVHLNVRDAAAVRAAWQTMRAAVGDRMTGAFVQQMAPSGPEFIVGSVTDRLFGPVVALGAGGTMAELMADVSFRLPPLSEYDVASMLRGTRAVRLLRGFRGEPPRDEGALAAVLLAVSALVDGCPEIRELDLNPVRVYERGALVLDARIRLGTPYGPPPGRVDY